MPIITVVVPVYNVEKYLDRCVNSIIAQTFTDFEVILVDDGSQDNCGKICDKYAEIDNRIHVIHKENGGLSSARCAGIEIAQGEYISFCDSDDYLSPDFLSVLYNAIIANECQCVSSMFTLVNDKKTNPKSLKNLKGIYNIKTDEDKINHISELLQNDSGWEVWSKLFETKIIRAANFLNDYLSICYRTGSYAEDLCFYFMYLMHCDSVYYLDFQGYYYVQRYDSILHSSSVLPKIKEMSEVSYGLYKYVQSSGCNVLDKKFPLIHIWIMNLSFKQITDYSEVLEAASLIRCKKWYKHTTKKSISFRKPMALICGKNSTFKILNTAMLTVNRNLSVFRWVDIFYYKYFADR